MTNTRAEVCVATGIDPEIIAQWHQIVASNPSLHSPFYSPEFTEAAAKSFPRVKIGILSTENRIDGILPFQFSTSAHRLLGAAERVAGELNDHFGLIARTGFAVQPNKMLSDFGLTSLYFTHLDESQANHGLQGSKPETGLIIDLAQGSQFFWESLRETNRHFVSETKRRFTRAKKDFGEMRFEFESANPMKALKELIEAKRRQYRRTSANDALAGADKFLAHLLEQRSERFRSVLSTLHFGSTWFASHFGLVYGNVLHYWFPVYNPDIRKLAPGHLLIKLIIDNADKNDIRVIDRGAGDTEAKRVLANRSQTFFRGVWESRGPRSMAAAVLRSLKWRIARLAP